MNSYYREVIGNLNAGEIAKASDINHIQLHIKDALKTLLNDMHNGDSYVLGTENEYKNSFILTTAPKKEGRYVDGDNIFTVDESSKCLNINRYDVRQPILKTKSSLYSIITYFKNTSNKNIPIVCELQDEYGEVYRSNIVTLTPNSVPTPYEIVFDYNFCPSPPNLDFKDLIERDGKDVPGKTDEASFDEGYDASHDEEEDGRPYFSAGVSKLYFVIKKANLNEVDLVENGDEEIIFDPDNSIGVYYQEGSPFPDKNIYAELNGSSSIDNYEETNGNIYYKDVYANATTYLCSGGEAIINGEKVMCVDTHISIEGASSMGNNLTQVYLDDSGHLGSFNRKTSLTTDINKFEQDENDLPPAAYLPVALILTYFNAQYGFTKEPLVIQSTEYNQLPASHHERLRKLEKRVKWNEDISIPARIKYTISDGDWVDENGESLIDLPHTNSQNKDDGETLTNDNIFITTDSNGNIVVKLIDAKTHTFPVTLKEKITDKKGKKIKFADTDILNISSFSSIKNMVHDSKEGTLVLDTEKEGTVTNATNTISSQASKLASEMGEKIKSTINKKFDTKTKTTTTTSKKSSKEVSFNPWDDSAANESPTDKTKKNKREYKVVSGKNGKNDRSSSYPGMTFYTKTNYRMKKLTIPIHEFENCSGVKFFIWKRQNKNNKKNVVDELEKLIYTSKTFSLKKAKTKGKRQFMDDGFTIDFTEDSKGWKGKKSGLTLPKAQYVIIALPIPKSGTGSMFVETYKPKNSKDFCIEYHGSANAAHFRLHTRYQEIWYNSASAVAEEEDYYKSGEVVSNTYNFNDDTLETIKTVKPVIGEHLTFDSKKTSYELFVNTGGDWIKVTPNTDNAVTGGSQTFKWKLVFKGDGKNTPKLAYNKKDGYAIKFIITREKSGAGKTGGDTAQNINKNMCITSKSFDGDDILREYVGDMNLGLTHSRFEGYEFARIWADKELNPGLLVDIQASDRKESYQIVNDDNTVTTKGLLNLWSLFYCDLSLDDFQKISVDYSDYDEELEYDENNMRLKLDSEHSYNDDDIEILALKDFNKQTNDIDDSTDKEMTFIEKESVKENQIFMKKIFENPIDLTKYTGLKFKFSVTGLKNTSTILNGLGIYISNSKMLNEIPTELDDLNIPEENVLSDTQIIPAQIDPDTSPYSYYEGNIIKITHKIKNETNGNYAPYDGYYQYVREYDSKLSKYVYNLHQLHDIRNYNIYNIGEIDYINEDETFEVRIELDQDSTNLKHVEEIGIISLNKEGKYSVEDNSIKTKLDVVQETNNNVKIKLTTTSNSPLSNKDVVIKKKEEGSTAETSTTQKTTSAGGISLGKITKKTSWEISYAGGEDTVNNEKVVYSGVKIKAEYDPSNTSSPIEVIEITNIEGEISLTLDSVRAIDENTLKIYDAKDVLKNKNVQFVSAEPEYVKIYNCNKIDLTSNVYQTGKNITLTKDELEAFPATQININHANVSNKILCYINNPFKGGLSKYKHIGIQLATDVYIPKDCLKINVCSDINGQDVIASVNLPTMNSIYYPQQSKGSINLSQIFKKLDIGDTQIKSISITATEHLKTFMNKILDTNKPKINLFIGKIVLYRAETIPIYHNKMRFKFYSTTNGKINHDKTISKNDITIRKIGAVLDYN